MTEWLLRNPAVVCVSRLDTYYFIRSDGTALRFPGIDVEQVSAVMMQLALPTNTADVLASLEEDTLSMLVEQGILLRGPEADLRKVVVGGHASAKPCGTLVLCVTGAVAALHTPSIVFDLLHNLAETIEVVLSEPAQKFVTPDLFPLLGVRVWHEVTASHGVPVPHIHLAREAEMVVVWPTSAHTLAKLAHGSCSELTSLIITATHAPVVLVPAMNHAMWTHPAIARNVAQVRRDGYYVVEPRMGIEVANQAQRVREYGNPGVELFSVRRMLTGILNLHAVQGTSEDTAARPSTFSPA